MTIPNALSLLRLCLVGVFVWFYFALGPIPALVVFLVGGATDLLDGYIARRFNQISDLGKLLDPLADKLLTLGALFCFQATGRIPLVIFILACIKEFCLLTGGLYMLRAKRQVVHSNWVGKVAMAVFYIGIVVTFIDSIQPYNVIILCVGLAFSYFAGVCYLQQYLLRSGKDHID